MSNRMSVCLSVIAGIVVGGTALAEAPAREQDEGIAEYLRIRTPNNVTLASDGRLYFRDSPDGVNQLFRREAGAPIDSQGEQLTDFTDGISRRQGIGVSPDARWVAIPADFGGNEQHDIYLLDTSTDEMTGVLVDPVVAYTVDLWLRDSSGFIYTANDDSPNDFHIYRYDIASASSTKISDAPGRWFVSDATRDGSRILATVYRSISDSRLFEIDTATGEMRDLSATPAGTPSLNFPLAYSADGQSVFMTSDANDEGIRRLYRRDLLASGSLAEPQEMLPELGRYQVGGGAVDDQRRFMAIVHNQEGYGTLRLFDMLSFEPIDLPEIDAGVVSASAIVGDTLIFRQSNAQAPGISFAFDIPSSGTMSAAEPRPLTTRMDDEDIDLGSFRLPELIAFESFDGLEVPAFLYLPQGFERGEPVPFVVSFHGGPESQARPSFSATTQYLVSQGYGVMVPNVRGSTGYGREYHMLDNYEKRWDSVRDGAEAARWLVKNGYAEAGRISSYGGSYGGFMSVATIIEGADVYGACVNIVGIVNFKTFLERTKGYRRKLREAEYGPLTDPEFLASVSPLTRIDEIKVPVLIAHGLNDPRVPVDEAMQLATELQKRGYDPEQIYFHDEGHGFAKLDNQILFYERTVKFLDETIGPRSRDH